MATNLKMFANVSNAEGLHCIGFFQRCPPRIHWSNKAQVYSKCISCQVWLIFTKYLFAQPWFRDLVGSGPTYFYFVHLCFFRVQPCSLAVRQSLPKRSKWWEGSLLACMLKATPCLQRCGAVAQPEPWQIAASVCVISQSLLYQMMSPCWHRA